MTDSAFLDAQRRSGAAGLSTHAPAPWASHFGDPRAEYQAARTGAAVFDLNDRTQIELTGRDRAKFLHNFCTNNVTALQPGEGCEAFITNVKGRVLGHVFVFTAAESLWLDTVPGAEEALLAHLDRYLITEDVQLCGRTAECAGLLVAGPQAAAQLATLAIPADSLAPYAHRSAGEGSWTVRRIDFVGPPGFLLSAPRAELADAWNRLAGAGIAPAGARAFHALRIEAGMPWYGVDISDDNLAQEVSRTETAISFTKGCYLGQEPIARIDALGHVNRALRGLVVESAAPPAPGSTVAADDGKEIGTVTSSAEWLADDAPRSLALAYLRRGWLDPGTEVRVQTGEQTAAAQVFWPGE